MLPAARRPPNRPARHRPPTPDGPPPRTPADEPGRTAAGRPAAPGPARTPPAPPATHDLRPPKRYAIPPAGDPSTDPDPARRIGTTPGWTSPRKRPETPLRLTKPLSEKGTFGFLGFRTFSTERTL